MKIPDSTTTPTFLLPSSSSSSILKKNKPPKTFKFNRRLNNRMATLSKGSSAVTFPINNYQIIPVSSLWTNTQLTPPNSMIIPMNTNPTRLNTFPPSVISPPAINQRQQVSPAYPLSKPFTTPRVTTTLVPLNICPTEYCHTTKPTSRPLVNIIENRQEQNIFENKSKGIVTTHLIGDWIIRESSEPFQRKENERSTPIEQLVKEGKEFISNESIAPCQSLSPNVNQWTTDDVCSFFERVLGKNCYTSIIQEHLIDGTALFLLEDEHLTSIFKMQLGPRLKLLNRIHKLKNGDLSGL